MKYFFMWSAMSLVCLLFCGCATGEKRVSAAAGQIMYLNDKEETSALDLAHIRELALSLKGESLSEKVLPRYSMDTLNQLYEAFYTANFYFPGELALVSGQEVLFREKIRRGVLADKDVVSMYKIYVNARLFEAAMRLGETFPRIRPFPIPEITVSSAAVNATSWRAYAPSDGSGAVRLSVLGLEDGPHIVMVIMTGCGVALRAMKGIMGDRELSAAMREYGVLLTDQFDVEGIIKWRHTFDFNSVYIAMHREDFPGMSFSSSPQFYFVKNGQVKFHFNGWGSEDTPNESRLNMKKGLATIGLHVDTAISAAEK